jgi:neurotrimin
MIWIPNQLVGAPLGTTVKLQCHTESSPRAISYWSFNDMMVLNSERFLTEESHHSEYKLDSTLTVRNLREEDFGSYRCISKNSLGETDGAIMLYKLEAATKKEEEEASKYVVESHDDQEIDNGE